MRRAIGTFAIALLVAGSGAASAQTLNATADAYVEDGAWANSNFGSVTTLYTRTSNNQNYDSYFKFDTTSIGGAANVARAKLRLQSAMSAAGSIGMSVYPVADTTWGETSITWNNKPARGAAIGTMNVSGTAFVYYELDVTSYVRSEKAAGRNVVSFASHNVSTSSQFVWIHSRENASGQPQLVITPNAAPTVSLTAPANNTVFLPGANVTVNATAADSDGTVAKVEFFDGGALIGTSTAAPYTTTLTSPSAGIHTLTAKATDNLGLATTSATVTIRVDASPTVSITAPANNSVLAAPASFTLTASAADTDGTVSKVAFFDGATLLGTATAVPYTLALTNVANGAHSYTARATDNDGAVTTSAAVAVTVDTPPTVSITSPANNAVFASPANITLNASASDSDGTVAKVEFYDGATLIGTVTAAPYSVTLANAATGAHSFTAKATDNLGIATTSAAVAVSVDTPPAVSLTSPATNSTYTAPANITITAQASDADGSVASVAFYYGSTLITTVTSAPYTFVWSGVPAGTYALTARVTDNAGITTTSGAVNVTVNAGVAQLYFIQVDHLNSPRLIANAAGQAVWRLDHAEPFGNSPPDENPSGLGAFEFPLRFPGQYFDKETNLHYNYFRDYDPGIGRYVQSDLIGLYGGLNTYAYAGGEPIYVRDPSGLILECKEVFAGYTTRTERIKVKDEVSGWVMRCSPVLVGGQPSIPDPFEERGGFPAEPHWEMVCRNEWKVIQPAVWEIRTTILARYYTKCEDKDACPPKSYILGGRYVPVDPAIP